MGATGVVRHLLFVAQNLGVEENCSDVDRVIYFFGGSFKKEKRKSQL